MKQGEFDSLSLDERSEVLLEKGTFIGKITASGQIRALYQLEAFYVEISYHTYRKEIKWMRSFNETDMLEPYINTIKIYNLINIIEPEN